ncbi:MAG: LysR family transcriptional regulator [Pseudomonadota bacterium]
MKSGLVRGLTRTRRFEVSEDCTIGFMGESMRVYATPFMVRDIERTCRDVIGEYLTEAENSVGARMEIDHLGPTLKDMWVDVTVSVTALEGRRVSFDAEVRDALEVVGRAKHVRFVVDLAKQRERLEAKAAKVVQRNRG